MMDQTTLNRLKDNWQQVQCDVSEAMDQCGRDPESVTIVGVSKYVDAELTKALYEAGCANLGESRPQSLWTKAEALSDCGEVHWHMIGHLQRNKIRRVLSVAPSVLIHSVDSERLLDSLVDESKHQECTTAVLLEVNIANDESKTGMSPDTLQRSVQRLPIAGVQVRGLMAMAGWGTDRDDARRQFDQVRQLRDDLEARFPVSLPELSMGMSGDFAEAIAAGATFVRIGSKLFDGIVER
jgi:pyridoxal phosphate enzyme (YggS family)